MKYGYEYSKLKTITDENGKILTGKKASIQFHYDKIYPNEMLNEGPEEVDIVKGGEFVDSPKADPQAEIPRVTMDTVNEVMKMLDKIEEQVKGTVHVLILLANRVSQQDY